MQDWLTMSAAALGRGIAAGEIDAEALTDTYLSAITSHPDTPRIYARTTEARARAEAAAAAYRARIGQRRGPLDGVPISWKDLFDTAGTATEAGSALLAGRVPTRDAEVLRTATGHGLVCLGKTHMSELAFSGLGLNPITATPPCINDREAVPGGSSSGAAASVAHGLAAAGIGSDTGGSVRIPAAWNDLVGLKTTPGLLPTTGAVPLSRYFDTVGPLARTVEDAALLLEALGGGPALDLRGATLRGARFLVMDTIAMEELDDAPARDFDTACARIASAGAAIEHGESPALTRAFAQVPTLYGAETYGLWQD
ncbi:MAG: amidase, partial [Shimia sp.]